MMLSNGDQNAKLSGLVRGYRIVAPAAVHWPAADSPSFLLVQCS